MTWVQDERHDVGSGRAFRVWFTTMVRGPSSHKRR